MKLLFVNVVLVALVVLVCTGGGGGDDRTPPWAKVAPEQIAEARMHGVPVAFENKLGMRFVLIPAGTFVMGSPPQDPFCCDDEVQHEVTLTRAYYMQVHEVTNEVYRTIHPAHRAHRVWGDRRDPSTWLELNRDLQPATYVEWADAASFAASMTESNPKRSYRLPTEAEWEYACRAGTTSVYAFGDRLLREQASFGLDENRDGAVDGPLDVGRYSPNAWGLYDMHGNAAEWCADWVEEDAEGEFVSYPVSSVVDPAGPRSGERKAVRGGSYSNSVCLAASGSRAAASPTLRPNGWSTIGFRLVSPLPKEVK